MRESQLAIRNEAEWPTAALADVCELISRGSAPAYVESSDTLAIGQRCVTESGFDSSFARPHDRRRMSRTIKPMVGDVLLNSTGTGTIGRSCTFAASGSFIVDGHVTVIRPKPHAADGRWIESLLRSPWGQTHLEARCFSGSTNQVELSRAELAGTVIPLPPVSEQLRISEILDAIDEVTRSTTVLMRKLELTRQGLLCDLLTRGVDDNDELRDPDLHPSEFHDTSLGRRPRIWSLAELGSLVAEAVDGPFGSNLKTEHYVPEPGVRVVRLQNIGRGRFEEQDRAFITEGHAAGLGRHAVVPGDLLVASLGDEQHPFARACMYPPHLSGGIVKADCFRLRFLTALADARYVMHVLNCPATRRGLSGLAQGVTRDRVNLGSLKRFVLAVPPVAEQERIAESSDRLTRRIRDEATSLAKLRRLKQGLMDDLLTGRVRVSVDTEGTA
jgi:type I restriction enzyme S subunit